MIDTNKSSEYFVREEVFQYSRFGCQPELRSIEALLQSGVVCIDKPSGPTSHQVSAWVKEILNVKLAGHGGTLDPKVTGVLPIALNSATKILNALLYGTKTYICALKLHADVDETSLREMCAEFMGEIYQLPPVRAAVKRAVRVKNIYGIDILEKDGRDVLMKIVCEAGTYIRTLCVDIGEALGIGAHMMDLRRIATCAFHEDEAVTLQTLKDAYLDWKEYGDEKKLKSIIQPAEKLVAHLPKVIIKDSAVAAVCHGANVAMPGILKLSANAKIGDVVAVMTLKGECVALGKALRNANEILNATDGIAVDVNRVFMERSTYPKMWRSFFRKKVDKKS